MRRTTYSHQYHHYKLTILLTMKTGNKLQKLTINMQLHQQMMSIAVHSDSVLRCAQTGIRNERSVLGAKRELKK